MTISIENIKTNYPLHYYVWHNDFEELDKVLTLNEHDKELRDCRGRTPLLLAVTLGHLESARVIIKHDADVSAETKDNWTAVQESVSTGDPELVQLILQKRDSQRYAKRIKGIPVLLEKLKEAPDFYVEMKWEFASWVPLVSRMCPSDTYKVYKQGSNVRIDTSLLGFDQNNWQRGSRTFVFKGTSAGAVMMEVDHTRRDVWIEEMRVLPPSTDEATISAAETSTLQEAVSTRLTTPIVTTYIDTDRINFERNKAGLWGWRSDKSEPINGYNCKVFSATNVELVTKTRTEHLSETDKVRANSPQTPLQSFLGIAEYEQKNNQARDQLDSNTEKTSVTNNPCNVTIEEYFNADINLKGRDIGRPKEIVTKVQKFKATLWLCEDYPLTLQEQIMPIVDLMAISSSHFAKLKDFIQMQLPSGFPVKIEIPLFHVLNARITFGNIFGCDNPVPGVTFLKDENDKLLCFVCDSCFECPKGYTRVDSRQLSMDDEDNLIQFAIQQSLMDAGTERDQVDIWEALRAERPLTPNLHSEDRQLQRAIQASFHKVESSTNNEEEKDASPVDEDDDLLQALQQSKELEREEERRRLEEEAVFEKIIKLSLTDK